jgi:hypothetical protein
MQIGDRPIMPRTSRKRPFGEEDYTNGVVAEQLVVVRRTGAWRALHPLADVSLVPAHGENIPEAFPGNIIDCELSSFCAP